MCVCVAPFPVIVNTRILTCSLRDSNLTQPLKCCLPKRKVVIQPSFFGGYINLWGFGGIPIFFKVSSVKCLQLADCGRFVLPQSFASQRRANTHTHKNCLLNLLMWNDCSTESIRIYVIFVSILQIVLSNNTVLMHTYVYIHICTYILSIGNKATSSINIHW